MNFRKLSYITLFFGSSFAVFGQETEPEPALVTDRPDATEAALTVPKGALQLETGAFYTSYEHENVQHEVVGYNTTLLRFGLLDNLELRLGWNFEEARTSIGGTRLMDVSSGLSPLLAGMKVNITEENGPLPAIGLIGHIFLPFSAGADYKPETTGVDFRFSLAHTLTENSSLGANIGAQWGDDSSEAAYIYTLVYGRSITDSLGFYAEIYGDFPENSMANHYWDAGFTFLLMNNLQLDATVGTSITKGQDLLLSAGVSYRIPK